MRAAALALVLLAPLPLGGNRPAAWALLAVAAGGLCLWAALRRPAPPPTRGLAGPAALWFGALAWAAVAPTLDAGATQAGLLKLLTAAGVVWLFHGLGASRAGRMAMLRGLGWGAVAWAAAGLMLLVTGDRLPFGAKTAHLGSLTGPFPNRNTAALWLALGACALLASGVQWRAWRRPVWLAGAAVLAVALALTQSRGGTVAACAGLMVTGLLLGLRRRLLLLGAVGAVAFAAMLPLGERLAATASAPLPRLTVWAVTWEQVVRDPWTGVGLGAFRDAFAAVRPRALLEPWAHAHQVPLELAWELGVPAAAALLGAVVWLALRAARTGGTTGAAAAGAATAAGLHGLVDFSPLIPAPLLLLAALLGLATGRRREAGDPAEAPAPPASAAGPHPRPAAPDRAPPPAPPA